jgi:glycosyltransferase involved in cell wall biosynthesis
VNSLETKPRTKILFISNDGSRTGAPWILLNLIRWLNSHHDLDMAAALMRNGSLKTEFEQELTTYTWIPTDLNKPERIHKRLFNTVLHRSRSDPGEWLKKVIEKERPDVIYLSTLVLGKYLGSLKQGTHPRIVSHVHELLPSLRQLSGDAMVQRQLDLSHKVISCAECVQTGLTENFHLPSERCIILPEFITTKPESYRPEQANQSSQETKGREKLKCALNKGLPVFGIGGNPISRKGFDLIPLFLKACSRQFGERGFLFVWIGCDESSSPHASLTWDLDLLRLSDQMVLFPSVAMASFRSLLSQLQVLTLLSKEDPFPLVALEAGLLEIPTVCFKGSGAIAEMADQEACVAVNYLDLDAFAEAVHRLCVQPEEAQRIGRRCRLKVLEELSLEQVAPRIADVILEDSGLSSTKLTGAS